MFSMVFMQMKDSNALYAGHDVLRSGSEFFLVTIPERCRCQRWCYLVDPASSHMLVSKIKPCMCKYELIKMVILRMAH